MKIAVYCSGDINALKPSIICLLSVLKNNKDKNFDYFIFTEIDKINSDFKSECDRICNKNNIKIFDIEILKTIFDYSKQNSFDRWPKEIYSNYIVPYYLNKLNYDYCIKLDYDFLCINSFSLKEVLPSEKDILSISLRPDLKNFIRSKPNDIDLSKFGSYKTVNAGFIAIDVKSYIKNNFYELFINTLIKIENWDISEYVEQFALAYIQVIRNSSYRDIPLSYNLRPQFPIPDKIINIHYNTAIKPWHVKQIQDLRLINENHEYEKFKHQILVYKWIEFVFSNGINKWFDINDDISYILVRRIKDYENLYINYEKLQNQFESYKRLHSILIYIYNNTNFNFKHEFIVNERLGYIQLIINQNYKNIHYEILFLNNEKYKAKVCLHFEKECKKFYTNFKYLLNHKEILSNSDENFFEYYIGVKPTGDNKNIKDYLFILIKNSIDNIITLLE